MSGIDKKLSAKLQSFLEKGGAEILPTTNPWELARFRAETGISVIYQNSKGRISYSDENGHNAFAAMQDGKKWTAAQIVKRIQRKTVEELLAERDGCQCFYCSAIVYGPSSEAKPTLEHLVAISDGGNNHLSNLALACEPCNTEAASLPVIQKVKLRETKRAKVAA